MENWNACHAHIRLLVFLRSDSANCHIMVCGDPWVGPMTPRFELGQDFCTVHLTVKFHRPTFNHSEVIVLANKQPMLKTSTSLCYTTPVHKMIYNENKICYRRWSWRKSSNAPFFRIPVVNTEYMRPGDWLVSGL